MKLYLLTVITILFFLNINAQTNIAIRGGFNYSTARAYYSDVKQTVGFVPGANLGIQLKTMFDGLLNFSPFIGYSSKGFIIKSKSNGDKTRNFIHYVDLVPLLSIDLPAGVNKSFVIAAGPSASLAIAGTEKTTIAGITTSSKIKFTTTNNYSLFDFGLHGSIGYHFNKIFVEAAYQYGLASINNEEEKDKRNIRNRTFSLNIGYVIRSYK